MRQAPLKVEVVDGRLVISIGISTLAFAFHESDVAKPYDYRKNDWVQAFRVTDETVFAREIALALNREEEDGTTPVHLLLDKACKDALEDGAEGVEEASR